MSEFRFLMTQKEFAERASISQQLVSSITAKGGVTFSKLWPVLTLAQALEKKKAESRTPLCSVGNVL